MIIKRWNGTAFVKEFPQTQAQLIRNAGDTDNIFDSNDKIKPAFLPDAVFDSLYFFGTSSATSPASVALNNLAHDAFVNAASINRSPLGYYWVQSSAAPSLFFASTSSTSVVGGKTYRTIWNPAEEGQVSPTGTITLEQGDWIVITKIEGGNGADVATAIVVTFAVVNNTYELATTAIDGIVRLSSRTTYATLSGSHVVSEGTLKTVIDNAGFAAGSHGHGSILTGGTITAAVVTPADGDTIVIADNSASGLVSRGIAIGTTTTTFLNNAGAWATPAGTYVHPTQTAISVDATNDGITVIDSVVVNTAGHVTSVGTRTLSAATASVPGHMTAAFATKLDGIAAGAQVNVGTNITYTDATRVIASSTGTNATLPEVVAAGVSGFMTGADKTKLNGIAAGANAYAHPTQTAIDVNATDNGISVIDRVQVNTAGHVTAVSLRNLSAATASVPGHMTAAFASKLDGITAGATNQTALALGGLQIAANAFSMVNPFFSQTATPATPLTGTVWFDIN